LRTYLDFVFIVATAANIDCTVVVIKIVFVTTEVGTEFAVFVVQIDLVSIGIGTMSASITAGTVSTFEVRTVFAFMVETVFTFGVGTMSTFVVRIVVIVVVGIVDSCLVMICKQMVINQMINRSRYLKYQKVTLPHNQRDQFLIHC